MVDVDLVQVRVDMTSSHSDMTVPQRADTALLRVNLLPDVWKSSLVHVYHLKINQK